jgi:hypothetical protein
MSIITPSNGLPQLNLDDPKVVKFLSELAETLAKVPEDQQADYLSKLPVDLRAVAEAADRKRLSDQMKMAEQMAALKKEQAKQMAALKKEQAKQMAALKEQLAFKPSAPAPLPPKLAGSAVSLESNLALARQRHELEQTKADFAAAVQVNILYQQQIEEQTAKLSEAVLRLTTEQTKVGQLEAENAQLKQMLSETLERLGK